MWSKNCLLNSNSTQPLNSTWRFLVFNKTDKAISIKTFHTKMKPINDKFQLLSAYQSMCSEILKKMKESQMRESGWTLISILHLEININKYKPIRGSSYIPLPNNIKDKHT